VNSFTAATPVLMADGSKEPISKVKVGEKVQATDPWTGGTAARAVTALIVHSGKHTLVDVGFGDGSTVTATDHHPFWDATTGVFTDAIHLHPGDKVREPSGRLLFVRTIHTHVEDVTAYNLTVEGFHTYYAGTTPILTHNCGNCGKYGQLKPAGPGNEINHIPADAATPISKYSGPSVRMEAADHRALYTTGGSLESKAWRQWQSELVDSGRIDEAIQMDINDITRRFRAKYEGAIGEMLDSLSSNEQYQALRLVPQMLHG
jgi:hypothetical protein